MHSCSAMAQLLKCQYSALKANEIQSALGNLKDLWHIMQCSCYFLVLSWQVTYHDRTGIDADTLLPHPATKFLVFKPVPDYTAWQQKYRYTAAIIRINHAVLQCPTSTVTSLQPRDNAELLMLCNDDKTYIHTESHMHIGKANLQQWHQSWQRRQL